MFPENCVHCKETQKKFRTTARRLRDKTWFWTSTIGLMALSCYLAITGLAQILRLRLPFDMTPSVYVLGVLIIIVLATSWWKSVSEDSPNDRNAYLAVALDGQPHLHLDGLGGDDKGRWFIKNSLDESIEIRPTFLRVSLEGGARSAYLMYQMGGYADKWKITTYDHLSRIEFRDKNGEVRVWRRHAALDGSPPRPLSYYLDLIERRETVDDYQDSFDQMRQSRDRLLASLYAIEDYVQETGAIERGSLVLKETARVVYHARTNEYVLNRGIPALHQEGRQTLIEWRKELNLQYGPHRKTRKAAAASS